MRTIELTRPSIDGFVPATQPEPRPRRGEALVRMRAASLNFLDLAVAKNLYPGAAFPLIPVADGAGEVVEVGEEVESVRPGDRVAIHPKTLWASGRGTARNAAAMRGVTQPGSLRELAAIPADTLVRVPDHLSWAEIAALPIAATTAWNALVCGDIGPGRTVALLGTGNVSLIALELAKARGATVIVTSSSDDKLARATALGADHVVNYRRTPDWADAVRTATGGLGADLVLETIGAATFAQSMAAARHGGTIYTIGFVSGSKADFDLMPVIIKKLRVQGGNTGSAQDLQDAMQAIASHRISPVIARSFALPDVREAYAALEGGASFGKLVIDLSSFEASRDRSQASAASPAAKPVLKAACSR